MAANLKRVRRGSLRRCAFPPPPPPNQTKPNQKRLYGVRAPTKRFRDSSVSADPTLAFILPLTDFISKSFAANVIRRRSCGQQRKSLQPDVGREGKDSAGAVITPHFGAQKAAQPRPRRAQGAGLAGGPGRRDSWWGTEPAAAGLLPGSLLPSGSPPRSAPSPCSSHSSPALGGRPGHGSTFSRNHTLRCEPQGISSVKFHARRPTSP